MGRLTGKEISVIETLILTFCRVAIALGFTMSALGKAFDVRAFEGSVSDFQLLPSAWTRPVAWAFLGAEFVIVAFMAVGGAALLVGFVLAVFLLLTFSFALILALRRNARISCNCFGRTEQRISSYDVVRNMLLVACAVAGMCALTGAHTILSGAEVTLVCLMAGCFVILVTNVADVVETLRRSFDFRL